MTEFHPSFGSDKLRVIENGLTTAYEELQFENRFTCGRLRSIVIIGRLSPEKGHDAIQAAAAYFPDVDFHILGASDFSNNEWQQYLNQMMPKNVHFYGKIDDIPRKVRALKAQLCIVPSRCNESFGLVAIEGMALSCLTIVRNKGGLAEIAKKTNALTFVEDEELIKTIDNINRLSDQQRNTLAKEQYTATMTFFGSSCYFRRLENMLVELVSNIDCE
jgi:glycosyltransferase involved in cell wall biosynthesis